MQDRPTRHEFATAPRVKASHSADTGSCVEVARVRGWAAVSDTKNTDLVQLEFPPNQWRAFRDWLKQAPA